MGVAMAGMTAGATVAAMTVVVDMIAVATAVVMDLIVGHHGAMAAVLHAPDHMTDADWIRQRLLEFFFGVPACDSVEASRSLVLKLLGGLLFAYVRRG